MNDNCYFIQLYINKSKSKTPEKFHLNKILPTNYDIFEISSQSIII
jgi:hypothetical protein